MSIRDAYEHCLIELNKVQAPSLLLDDFVYFFNKAVQQYINSRYNLFEIKQQLTDDLRVLLMHKEYRGMELFSLPTISLPDDYMHILNCQIEFKYTGKGCKNGTTFIKGVNKVDTGQWAHIMDNYYMKPSAKQPYFYIMNRNDSALIADTSYREELFVSGNRYGNSVKPVMEIKYGNALTDHKVEAVYVDYLRAPRYYSITVDELDDPTDTTEIIEFPDYVVYEIVNVLVKLVMENSNNPRVQNHVGVNTSIA